MGTASAGGGWATAAAGWAAAAAVALGPAAAAGVLSSPDANVARNPGAALRRAVPSVNPALLEVRQAGERSARQLRIPQRKPWGKIGDDIQFGLDRVGGQNSAELLRGLPESGEERGQGLLR